MTKDNQNEPEFDGIYHIRMKSGLELVGALFWLVDEEGAEHAFLHRPVRVVLNNTDGMSVSFAPYTLFSDNEFFDVEVLDIEFNLPVNKKGAQRYVEFLKFWEEYKIQEAENESDGEGDSDEPEEKKPTLH